MAVKKTSAKPKAKTVAAKRSTLKGGPATFIKNKAYTKADFKIKHTQASHHIIHGKFCFFFTLGNQFKNEEQKDGFVFEARHEYELVPYGTKQSTISSVFVREKPRGPFIYRGDSNTMTRYNDKCNKLLWG